MEQGSGLRLEAGHHWFEAVATGAAQVAHQVKLIEITFDIKIADLVRRRSQSPMDLPATTRSEMTRRHWQLL
jgi:hypothetical protein